MPSKYKIISEMAAQTAQSLTQSRDNYTAFLKTAANNFKYSFPEQLLIFAQKPEATACAEIETWNRLGRWVNKGTHGIALLVDGNGPYRLRHVFDLSDTNSNYYDREISLWQMEERYESTVRESLENAFAPDIGVMSFPSFLTEAAQQIVEDNLPDYLSQLDVIRAGSFLEELEEDRLRMWLKDTLSDSVGYMLLIRCGYDPNRYFPSGSLAHLYDFNTVETISVLGAAASDISEMMLREIGSTVRDLERDERKTARTFADTEETRYDAGEREKVERSDEHGDDVHETGRLLDPGSGSPGEPQAGEIRDASPELSAGAPEGDLRGDAAERDSDRPSGGDRPAGQRDDGNADLPDVSGRGGDREPESLQSDGVGAADEQHPPESGGAGAQRPDLQLSRHDFAAGPEYPFFYQDDEKQELLRTSPALKDHRIEIAAYFAEHRDGRERGNFIKNFFDSADVDMTLDGGQSVGYKAYGDLLHMWRGTSQARESEEYLRWQYVAENIYGMMILERWLAPDEQPLPTVGEQLSLIREAEDYKANAFTLPQAAIDYVLARGSGFENGKFRILRQFRQSRTPAENIRFLKDEYGTGGRSSIIPGSGYWEDHDSRGIRIRGRFVPGEEQLEFRLSWAKAEKRIRELIAADRYLWPQEVPAYEKWEAAQDAKTPGQREIFEDNDVPAPAESRLEEMLAQAELAVRLSEETGELVFGFEEGNPDPINITAPEPEAESPLAPPVQRPVRTAAPTMLYPEIPAAERHDYAIRDDEIGAGTPGERYANNIAAIRLLKTLDSEQRLASPEEQEILAKYVGWGGLAEVFEETNSRYSELKSLLSEEEYASARESTLTAFYTPPVVVRSIYKALENMGLRSGNLLEPSCGIGHFIGMKPDGLSNCRIYGVELDAVSGRIARQLYQRSSIAVQGFEKTDLPDSFFDAAIGNIPFGNFKVSDRQYDKHNFLIHDYFFAKALDKLRPGGVIAFVTSKGTMDKETPTFRKYLAQRADLIGAIRLPNNTFKAAAGTEVTSDILFLQKRDRLTDIEPEWVHLNTDANGLRLNQYYVNNSQMILGEMRQVSGPYGPETTCVPFEYKTLDSLLSEAVESIHAQITEYDLNEAEIDGEDRSLPADPSVRNFSYALVEGQIYYRENSRMMPVETSATAESRIKGLIEIRDCVRHLIEYQTEDYPDSMIEQAQTELNTLYDSYAQKYGRINSRANRSAFGSDSSYFLLSSLEVLDDEGNFQRKADMFSRRTIKQHTALSHVDTAPEALALSMGEKARVDMPYMMELTGKSEEELYSDLKGVIFLNPEHNSDADGKSRYLPADEYLSGNVRQKLALARRSAELYPEDYAPNVEALEKVQPKDLTASEISVRLGATWIPPEDYQKFIFELFDTPRYCQWNIKVHYAQYTGEWNVEGKNYDRGNVKANSTYGTVRINGYKIIEQTLNLKDVRIFDYIETPDGKRTPVLNKEETAIAQGKQELIKQAFQDWIWKDPYRRDRLTKLYNEKYNSTRPREYDGSHLILSGMNPEISLRPHQLNAVARGLYGGNTLLGHVVGAGKTYTMIAIAQESKRLGLCQKSMIVVPNHLTEQWASDYLQLYPSANILIATARDFEAKNRKRFCSRIATGDYDAVIIGHSQLEKIPLSADRQRNMLEQELQEILDGIRELKENRGDRFSVKQMERAKKTAQAKLEKLNDQSRKDDLVTFEELGVDRLFIDEAHYYKNLAAFTKMRNVGGISQTEAMKSSDLFMKCRYLDELTGGRGIIFATGTPISNTMVEMYTMQKYLQYDTLRRNDLLHFDSWASTFGETVTAIELAPEGTGYRSKTRFARFFNLPELIAMFKEVADIQTADMLRLPVPEAMYNNIALKPSEHQKEMVESLSKRAERIRGGMVNSSEDNMLVITNDGRKLALDQRLLNPLLPDNGSGKIAVCAEQVFSIWQETAAQKSAQLVFCDLSTPHGNGEFNVYDDIRSKLIEKGIPSNEIAFIHSANTEAQKKELFGKVRSGQIRVLIGSTQKMGAGTNVQQRLIALHHLDCPWRPADLQQREGRIVRQGNENPQVKIFTYVTENTFDSYLYQLVESKQRFIGQIMTSKSPVRSAEDIDEIALSYAEIKALCAGNPYIKEKMDLDVAVQRLKLLKSNHLSQHYALEDKLIKEFPIKMRALELRIEGYEADIACRDAHPLTDKDRFCPMIIDGKIYTEKKAAGSAIMEACQALTSPDAVPLGEYRGFFMELGFDVFSKEYRITLKKELSHTVSLGTDIYGNIQRIDNALASFEEYAARSQEELANLHLQMDNAKEELAKPFPQEEELQAKSARLTELNKMLDLDQIHGEIVDGEREDEVEKKCEKVMAR